MNSKNARRALIASLVHGIGLSGLALVFGSTPLTAQQPCCPPIQACPPSPSAPVYQYAPSFQQTAPTASPEYVGDSAPMATQPRQVPTPVPSSSAPTPSYEEPMESANNYNSSFDNADLSSGLATNFGSGGAGSLAFADVLGGSSSVGYIDSALVRNQIRFRFDASYDNPTPDRAEFFYPQCGCFGPQARGPGDTGVIETGVDYQEFSMYAETLLFSDMFSGFVELPFRLINPEVNDNTSGVSDLNFGVKAALLKSRSSALTFQLRTYVPTGDGSRGLGTEHVTLEPGLLFMKRYCNGATLEGEIRDFIPIDGTEGYAGNVLRYGLGISKTILDDGRFSITPVFETVAWSVLSGDVLTETGPESAETTIVNSKIGARFNLSPRCQGQASRSLYVGYGKALTDDRWYDDTLRMEYRFAF